MTHTAEVDERLQGHLRSWLGTWPPARPVPARRHPNRGGSGGRTRRLVAQGARRVLADAAVPVHLHAESDVVSARTADASGFPDVGWRILGLFGGTAGTP